MTIELANRLIEFRKKAGLSQEELADKLNISRQAVSKWERGESSPDTDNLIALAKIYNVSLDELVGNETTKEKEQGTKVNIGKGHIDVTDEDGSEVHVSFDGVEVIDKKDHIHIKKENHEHNILKLFGLPFIILCSCFTLCVVLTYVITGCTYQGTLGTTKVNAWQGLWPLFILIPVPDSILRAIKHKKFCEFNFVFAVTATYLFVGMLTGLWHPYWFLFLFIPVYYTIFGLIDNYKKKNKNIIDGTFID